jgi:hypothetical protein
LCASAFVLALASLAVVACHLPALDRPPLAVRHVGDLFVIDVQTLGEYQTSVARIRLSHGNEVLWEVEFRGRSPGRQIHTFPVRVGVNPGSLQECGGGPVASCDRPQVDDQFAVLVGAQSFVVERGTTYLLEIWGSNSRWSRVSANLVT